jgi:flagellar M-ring protein FliF
VAGAILFLAFRGCAPAVRNATSGYTVIYSNMDLKDAANVVARLKELAIPYEIRDKGRAIAVTKDKVDQARLGLAEKNLPAGGVVGWEIFDVSKLGATDFDRRIQLIRAISGELSRTITRIEAVDDARVQIVLPETRLFATSVAPVTASVMLRLRPGAELTPEKIKGIVYLVASSVENLQPENITVIDDTGRILTAKGAMEVRRPIAAEAVKPVEEAKPAEVVLSPEEAEAAKPAEAAKRTEIIKAKKVVVAPVEEKIVATREVAKKPALLGTVLPAVTFRPLTPEEKILLKVQAKKDVELNLAGKAQEILNRFYPPNTVIVKINVDLENGVTLKDKEFKVKKLNAVILVDNRITLSQSLKESTYKSVAAAVGYNRKRGDQILLQMVPFHLASPPPAVVKGEVEKAFPARFKKGISIPAAWYNNILWVFGVLIGALILLVFIRMLGGRKPRMARVAAREEERPRRAAPVPAVERIRGMVDNNPERIAELLKNWLTE